MLLYTVKEKGGKPDRKPHPDLPYGLRNTVHAETSSLRTSVADPDPGSGAFLTPGPGSGKGFFPDPGSRIPDLGSKPHIFKSLVTNFWVKSSKIL